MLELEGLYYLHLFSNELKMQMCMCVSLYFFMCLIIAAASLSSVVFHCVTFFSSSFCAPLILWHSALLFFFSSTEYFKMQKCQHETLNPRHNWTKNWTLECFYSWRKWFIPLLYCHSVCLFIYLFVFRVYRIYTSLSLSICPLCNRHPVFHFHCISLGWHLSLYCAASLVLFPFTLCTRSFVLFCNPIMSAIGFLWSSLEPSGWASKPALK